MRTEPSPKNCGLRPAFKSQSKIETHYLQPGRSMLVGYPDTEHANKVFLVTQISAEEGGGVILLQTNGETKDMTLSGVVKNVIKKDIGIADDHRILKGGKNNAAQIMLVTQNNWFESSDSVDMGVCRLHYRIDALKQIAKGNMPEKIAVFLGITGFAYDEFMTRLQNNEFGEIAFQEDMVFGEGPTENQWQQAMNIHTRGQHGALFVPHPTNEKNAPRPC